MHRSYRIALAALALLALSTAAPAAAAQEATPASAQHVDLIVMASGYVDGHVQPTMICVDPEQPVSTITLSRRPLAPDLSIGDHPLWVRISPFVSTAHPYVESANVGDGLTLTIPQLSGPSCFSFENYVSPEEAQRDGRVQIYKMFAQVVTIDLR